jgi:hypothetical protein
MRAPMPRQIACHRPDSSVAESGPFALVAWIFVGVVGCSNGQSPPGATGAGSSSSGPGEMTSTGEATGTGTGTDTGTSGSSSGGSSSSGSGSSGNGSSSGMSNNGGSGSGSSGGSSSGTGGSSSGVAVGSEAGAGGEGGTGQPRGGDGGAAATGCAGKTYKLCEDFETGTAGAIPTGWTPFKGYGGGSATDVALATDQFHSGKMSLKSDSMATGQGRAQKSLATLGATAAKHWGRIFYKVQSPAPKPSGGVIHITFTSLTGQAGENRIVDTVENGQGTHQWLYNLPSDACSKGSAYSWSFDTAWHCAEWYVDVATNSYRFFSDSQEVTSIGFNGMTCDAMSNYTAIIVGSTFYQMPPSPFVMWFDDLAIDDNQIGCQ